MIEFKNSIDNVSFLNGVRLNIAIEHDNEAFLKLKVKVRDKIVADGLHSNEYNLDKNGVHVNACLLYTSPSPRDATLSRMPSSA